jgi:hypothetical protein
VANPLAAYGPIIHDGKGPGRNARPDPVALIKTSIDNYSESLSAQFFGKDKVDRGEYTVWIFAALGLILSIWVVAGLGLMTSVEAISSILISPSFGGMAAAPLYAGLLAVLSAGFVGILFTVHRARQAAWHEPIRGFAGFAWDVQD